MINKYIGETIKFNVVAKDNDGTALTLESPALYVFGMAGTLVGTTTGTHSSSGSYYANLTIGTSWGTGPVKYYWQIAGGNGSAIKASTNELNILSGTTEPEAYVFESELNSYYSGITSYFGENTQDKIIASYNYINRMLESLNIITPRPKNDDGFYDQSVRDMNAWLAIYHIIEDDQVNRVGDEKVPWYKRFHENFVTIYEDIKKKKIVFNDQMSPSEAGVQAAYRTAGSSIGTMFNNSDRSYGDNFRGDDYPRTWIVEINGTGTTRNLEACTFKWSTDNGINWEGTGTTSIDWQELQDEVYVRFDRGTSTGTETIFGVGDQWKFKTVPLRMQSGGIKTVKSYGL